MKEGNAKTLARYRRSVVQRARLHMCLDFMARLAGNDRRQFRRFPWWMGHARFAESTRQREKAEARIGELYRAAQERLLFDLVRLGRMLRVLGVAS